MKMIKPSSPLYGDTAGATQTGAESGERVAEIAESDPNFDADGVLESIARELGNQWVSDGTLQRLGVELHANENAHVLLMKAALASEALLSASSRARHWRQRAEDLQARVDSMQRMAVDNSESASIIEKLERAAELAREDARLNTAQAARGTAEAVAKLARMQARAIEAERRVEELAQQIQTVSGGIVWRFASRLHTFGVRYPRVRRVVRNAARLVYWSLRFQLFKKLREVRRINRFNAEQAKAKQEKAGQDGPSQVTWLTERGAQEFSIDVREAELWPQAHPLVSVVIPCFNYGHLVHEAVQSILDQTCKDVEIIVVEGGSSAAESRQRIAELAERAPDNVRILLQDRPHRAGANRNFGISHARGRYICCLDADDLLAPTYLEKAVFLLETYAYDVVSAGLKRFGENNTETWNPMERPDLPSLLNGNEVVTCAVFRKELWRLAGGYRDTDPTGWHIHEDWVFWVRLAALGARFFNIRGECLFFYRTHGATLSNSSSVLDNELQREHVRLANEDVLDVTSASVSRIRAATTIHVNGANANLARIQPRTDAPILLLATGHLILGGAERLLSAVIAHLKRCGWRIIIVTTVPVDDSHGDTTSWFEPSTSEIYHLPRFLSQDRWRDFVDYLLETRAVDVLWIVGSAFIYEQLPSIEKAFPKLRVADMLFNTVGHTSNNRKYAAHIDLHIVENLEVRRWLVDKGENQDNIQLIVSGVDTHKYKPGPKNDDLLAKYAIQPGTLIVGFSGRWSEEKDPVGFIEIAKRVPAEVPVCFMMTGRGPLDNEVRVAAASASLPTGRLIICGDVPDVEAYLRTYDVLVLNSKFDGRPNVVMEAMASAVPVVASRVGALPEMLEDGISGYLCEIGDYDTFARRIVELAKDQATLARLKGAAREFAVARCDINRMLDSYEQGFNKLLTQSC
ncbi:glycosyltransferase [Burkholderia ubonensis]|uniref:glycosyltransferase n=1 Tax=Burkholderia ubonensis TaxID=101571 RepID=UPI0009B39414|nr:glycosyltransferase [Burkholderia ubonensis]